MNHILSICILFCDKDACYVPSLIKIIRERVHIKYEIILIDNRKSDFSCKIDSTGCTYIQNKTNKGILYSRKQGFEASTGDYIWFVDADDEIYSIDECMLSYMDQDYGVISFSFFIKNSKGLLFGTMDENHIFKEPYKDNHILEACGWSSWNKWIRRDIMEKVVSFIPDKNIIAAEDLVIGLGAFLYSENAIYVNRIMYQYNLDISYCHRYTVTTLDYIKTVMQGFNESRNILHEMYKDKENKGGLEKYIDHIYNFFVSKIYFCDNTTFDEVVKYLYKTLGKERFIKSEEFLYSGNEKNIQIDKKIKNIINGI